MDSSQGAQDINKGASPAGPMLVDSHAHLDMEEFDPDREDVLRRAFRAGVTSVLCPMDLTSEKSITTVLGLTGRHPSLFAAAGVHPHQAGIYSRNHAARLHSLHADGHIAAVGEIGLDFHYDFSTRDEQRAAFLSQVRLAGDVGLPVLIHSRLAGAEVIAGIRESGFSRGGVLHCFTETWEIARAMIDLGFLISFSGILTFPKAEDLRDVARQVPMDKLLVETDSPYLAPVPLRDRKRNEPAFVVETARVLAALKSVPMEELAAATTRNFHRLFGAVRH
jgi:TatD DNase family protein